VGLGDVVYFSNAATEVVVAQDAHVRHVRLQQEAPAAFHIASSTVALGRDARYTSQTVMLGARVSGRISVCSSTRRGGTLSSTA
jgi:Fe-S cluster assembly protein SufD